MTQKLKWIGLVSLLPIGALVVFLAYVAYQETIASADLERKLDEMREAGEPFDNASMAIYFEKHTRKEGTEAWGEVLAMSNVSRDLPVASDLPSVGTGKYPQDLRVGSDWPDEPRVAEYLNEVRPILKRIHLASEFPKPVWMPLHFDGFGTLLQPIQDCRLAVGILDLDAAHALYHNDSERALKDLIAMRSVADAFDWSWWAVAQYTTWSIQGWQRTSINRSLAMDVWNEEQLAKLSAEVDKPLDIVHAWKASYVGQIGMFLGSLDNVVELLPREQQKNPLWNLPILPSTRLACLRGHEALKQCADQGEDGLMKRAKTTFASLTDGNSLGLTRMYLGMLLPFDALLAVNLDRQETARRLTLTSLAVKRFQLKHKRWPNNLTELADVGLVSQDWTTTSSEVFGYHVTEDLVFVWSFDPINAKSVSKSKPVFQLLAGDDELNYLVSIR